MSVRGALRGAGLPAGAVPALLVLGIGVCVVLLRPALPIDETRYLQVFHESLRGSPLLLRLSGEPYAEKPPLLFWVARALTWLALPPDFALRSVPALTSAGTVLFAARLGRSAGIPATGWFQAALAMTALASQFLLFDSLLALAVWGAVDAWVRRKDLGVAAWSAAGLLAKGPVAYLFLIPLLWSTAPLRVSRSGDVRRATLALLAALVPLAAWALAAAALGGPEFADALLWNRWAGRIVHATEHVRPLYFYVPVVLVGALPLTALLFRRAARGVPALERRLAWTLAALLVAFTLIRAKQVHYLVPATPALALLVAGRVALDPRGLRWVRAGVVAQLGVLLAVAVAALAFLPHQTESFGAHGRALLASGGWRAPLVLAGACALTGLLVSLRARMEARTLLAVALASSGASLLPIHYIAGELLYPHALADALRDGPPAVVGSPGTELEFAL